MPPLCFSKEASIRELQLTNADANVKPARTASGGEAAFCFDDWRDGLEGSKAPFQLREEEQSSLDRPARARPENCSDDERLQGGHRPAFESGQETKRCRRGSSPGRPLAGETGELTMSAREEREARENQ